MEKKFIEHIKSWIARYEKKFMPCPVSDLRLFAILYCSTY